LDEEKNDVDVGTQAKEARGFYVVIGIDEKRLKPFAFILFY
jgi:hypothetical protein